MTSSHTYHIVGSIFQNMIKLYPAFAVANTQTIPAGQYQIQVLTMLPWRTKFALPCITLPHRRTHIAGSTYFNLYITAPWVKISTVAFDVDQHSQLRNLGMSESCVSRFMLQCLNVKTTTFRYISPPISYVRVSHITSHHLNSETTHLCTAPQRHISERIFT